MDDGDLGAIEMSNTGHSPVCTTDDFDDEEVMLEAREPFAWVNSHVQRQNRCFVMVLVLMITVAAVYVMGGVSLVQEEALEGDKYDAESGILTDGFASVEEQDLYERQHDDSKYNRDWWAAHGKDNPFGNQNAVEHGNNQVSRARWNTTHPGQPFPGHGGLDKRHPGTLGKKGGKKGGNNALHPGNRPDRPNNGQSGGKNMGLRPGKVNSRPTPHNPGQSSGSSNGHASDRHTQQCDHSAYADWIAATVTIADGLKYEIVERIAHDNQAFV